MRQEWNHDRRDRSASHRTQRSVPNGDSLGLSPRVQVKTIYTISHRPNWAFNESAAARTSGGVTLKRSPIRLAIVPAIMPNQKTAKSQRVKTAKQKTAKSQRVKTGKQNMKTSKTTKTATKPTAKVITVSFHKLRTNALKALGIDAFSKEALQKVIAKAKAA
jgi:hypothetical protein